jgi:hypothetical protein
MLNGSDESPQLATMEKNRSQRGIPRFVGRAEVADALGYSLKTLNREINAATSRARPTITESRRLACGGHSETARVT